MSSRFRFDRGAPAKPVKVTGGGAIYSGHVARTGEHVYPWGTERRDSDELASIVRQLVGKPVVSPHPPGLIRDGAEANVVGVITSAWVDGQHAAAKIRVDALGEKAISEGANELSLGYEVSSARGEQHRGTFVDHVALVFAGRCGASCSVRTDRNLTDSKGRANVVTQAKDKKAMADNDKDRTDAQNALSNALAQKVALEQKVAATETERDDYKSRMDSATGEVDSLKERVKTLETERNDDNSDDLKLTITGLTAQVEQERTRADAAEDPKRLAAAVNARVKLETSAIAVYGDTDRARLDDKSDREVMVGVVEKLQHAVIAEDKSEDYVRARFDAAIEGYFAGASALENMRRAASPEKKQTTREDSMSPRDRMVDRNQNAWKPVEAS